MTLQKQTKGDGAMFKAIWPSSAQFKAEDGMWLLKTQCWFFPI